MNVVFAYTDGSAVSRGVNKGKGGFGTYFPNLLGTKKGYSLGFKETKTGRMEVMALLYALRAMPYHDTSTKLIVYSDSEYVVKTFTENRLQRWIATGWRNTSGEVKNKDLWKAIVNNLNMRKYMSFEIRHIRSHQVEKEKDPKKKALLLQDEHIIGNMMADRLADYKRHKVLLDSDDVLNSNK